jgi:hypothetical protein
LESPLPTWNRPAQLEIIAGARDQKTQIAQVLADARAPPEADLPLQDPKLMPKDREFSLAIRLPNDPDRQRPGRRSGTRRQA